MAEIDQAEAYQISLVGGPAGEQHVVEQHGWWNERRQHAEWLPSTSGPNVPFPLEGSRDIYNQQIQSRVQEGFVHSRSYSFLGAKFVYRDLTGFKL